MKAGFWVAPEGCDDPMTVLPIGGADEAPAFGRRAVSFLASASPEELTRRCPQAARLLPELARALAAQKADAKGRLFDLTEFGADDLTLIDQVTGEGEVAGVVALPDGVGAQIQEATMAGLWRVRFTRPDGGVFADYLEVASIPEVVKRAALVNARALDLAALPPPPEGAANAPSVLAEIAERAAAHRPGAPSHVINFTLLPMSGADLAYLQETLGPGAVRLVSRGYGSCRVVSTGVRNVWSAQFFNASDAILLDTLEIGDPPSAARAEEVDFADSAERLDEIVEAYFR